MSNSGNMGIKERLSYWRESLAYWWDLHGGMEGIWDELVSPIQWKWESFNMWRRKRNPELVELDAYRELGERASVSNFQRKLGIGYNQAVQIWELFEERGLIGTVDNH